ncbi:MAG: rRNA maturation RNase YbeY [Flavobacteriaceae bacterium]|nr:rRNA maturation RNase YbeY [Flavobacteriaceae bacterium]
MIQFNYETDIVLENEEKATQWIADCISMYDKKEGEINYIFCDDEYLYKLNQEFLQHDTLTDIISFDYTMGNLISGDIFISVDRVRENAVQFGEGFHRELHRVMIHGVLHYIGFKDKAEEDKKQMRLEEEKCLQILEK